MVASGPAARNDVKPYWASRFHGEITQERRFCCVGKPATPQRQPILHFALAVAGELLSSMTQASHGHHSS